MGPLWPWTVCKGRILSPILTLTQLQCKRSGQTQQCIQPNSILEFQMSNRKHFYIKWDPNQPPLTWIQIALRPLLVWTGRTITETNNVTIIHVQMCVWVFFYSYERNICLQQQLYLLIFLHFHHIIIWSISIMFILNILSY